MTIRLKRLARLHGSCSSSHKRPYVALEHIEGWTGKLIEGVELPVLTPASSGMATAEVGDVLFGKLRPYLAKSWVVDRPALASTELMCIRPGPALDSRWLGYMMSIVPFVEWASATSDGTRMPRTSWEKIGEYRSPIPSRVEQLAIADYLDTKTDRIDTLIAKKRQLIQLLEERKSLLAEEEIAMLRDTERSVPLKYLVYESDRRYRSGSKPTKLSVSIHRGVTPRDALLDKGSRTDDLSSYKKCSPGDIAINRMRAFQGGVGVVGQTGVVSPDYTVLRIGRQVSPRYLHYVMRSSWFVLEMTRRLRGIGATDQGQVRTPRINFADLGRIEVPVPPREEQDDLALNLANQEASLTHAIDLQVKQVALLSERRHALVTAVVTGEIPVPRIEV